MICFRSIERLKCFFIKPYETPIGWFPIFLICGCCAGLYTIGHYLAATLLLLILGGTIAIVLREDRLRRSEIYRKVRSVLDEIQLAHRLCNEWSDENYPNLCSPLSPCVTLQWTYRDGRIVNLPWALLVKGDYIILRPGQVSPGLCTEINGKHKFEGGETYGLSQVNKYFMK